MASSAVGAFAPDTKHKLARTFAARRDVVRRWQKQCAAVRDPSRPLVWFHAPSVGEGLQARPVIELLRATRPDIQIAYSFFSPSAEKFAASLKVDIADFLPFDSTRAASAMIDALKLNALFFSKLDVWPNLVRVARTRGVRTGLLSGTISPQSGRQGGLAKSLLRDAYAALDVVGAIDSANAERLVALGAKRERVTVSGDTRFDQVWARANGVDRNSDLLRALHATQPTLVAGSTWPSDEAVLLPAWLQLRARVADARLIVAPHEPTEAHLAPILAWAKQHNLQALTLAQVLAQSATPAGDLSVPTNSVDVIVVDRVGVLGDIYAIADVAFVGGAFHKAGLHSVLEPAAYGVPVLFGPAYAMSREAELLIAAEGARSVATTSECAEALIAWMQHDDVRTRSGMNAKQFVQSDLGSAERSLQLVLETLR